MEGNLWTKPIRKFLKGAEILNLLNANFRGADHKKLGCWNLPSTGRGGGCRHKKMECPIIECPNFQDQTLK